MQSYSPTLRPALAVPTKSELSYVAPFSGRSDYVLHTASPVAGGNSLEAYVDPAVHGTSVVVKAAVELKIPRVVVTSSNAAIAHGGAKKCRSAPPGPSETRWSVIDGPAAVTSPYAISKTLAERAAWKLVEGTETGLTVINPTVVIGPILTARHYHTGSALYLRLILGGSKAIPKLAVTAVDVRDVARAHLLGLVDPTAKGERYLGASTAISVPLDELARIIARRLAPRGFKVPTTAVSSISSGGADALAEMVPAWPDGRNLAQRPSTLWLNNRKFRSWLGPLIPIEDSVVAMAESAVSLGMVRPDGSTTPKL